MFFLKRFEEFCEKERDLKLTLEGDSVLMGSKAAWQDGKSCKAKVVLCLFGRDWATAGSFSCVEFAWFLVLDRLLYKLIEQD